MIGAIATAASSVLGNLFNLFSGKKQNKQNTADINNLGVYQQNPLAGQQLALANNLFNGRMAGAAYQQGNIYQNQANATESVQNNATDASQALAILAGLQGQSNASFADLAAKEAADKINRAGLVMNAQNTVINEGDKEWNDKLRQLQQKIGVRAVNTQNNSNAVNGMLGGIAQGANIYDYYNYLNKTTKK